MRVLSVLALISLALTAILKAEQEMGEYEFKAIENNPFKEISNWGAQFPSLQIQNLMNFQHHTNMQIKSQFCLSRRIQEYNKKFGIVTLEEGTKSYGWVVYCKKGECATHPNGHIFCDIHAENELRHRGDSANNPIEIN